MTKKQSQKPIQQNLAIGDVQTHTPMMAQYWEIKQRTENCLLFYRMGDFYELFFEDAIIAAKTLDITLTKRGQHQGQDIAMCGVPVHSHESYLHKLIAAGFKIAICEQLEDPKEAKKRGPKSVVKRDIVRIITPGTITEDNLLNARSHNYLLSIMEHRGKVALAWLDISTGDFYSQSTDKNDLINILHQLEPSEILFPTEKKPLFTELTALFADKISFLPLSRFDSQNTHKILCDFFELPTQSAFADFSAEEITAAGSLLDYVRLMQINHMPHIGMLKNFQDNYFMQIDRAAHINLEICQSAHGKNHSLLGKIDKCHSAGGARLLKTWLSAPLCHMQTINNRYDAIEWSQNFNQNTADNSLQIIELLKSISDIERALNRINLQRGTPRDMQNINQGLKNSFKIKALLAGTIKHAPTLIQQNFDNLHNLSSLQQQLSAALKDELPALARDGGFIKAGFSAQLDHLHQLSQNGRQILLALEQKYRKKSGIDTLKIKQNNVLGIFIEISTRYADKLDTDFIHRQSTATSARFTTNELEESARNMVEANHKAIAIELDLFTSLCHEIMQFSAKIFDIAHAINFFDLVLSQADFADKYNYCRPIIDDSRQFHITQGRHPIVELSNITQQQNFIANDCELNQNNFLWLLTGPNMAGKSTFLRQNALIVVMAQAGLYVPANQAHIGMIDKLFSRVGAGDDIARGHSTFMVEMLETSAILNRATDKSFVILDEIGRGTATFDGLSLAHAITEYLHDVIKCRTLFATHYHELNQLRTDCPNLSNMHIAVKEYQGDIIFTHQIKSGSAERSYGIHVAKLAGIHPNILKRATHILQILEQKQDLPDIAKVDWTSESSEQDVEQQAWLQIKNLLNDTDIDELSPKQALEQLYHFKNLLDKNK